LIAPALTMVPLGNVLTIVGCLGGLAMLPHMIKPNMMCKMFLAEKFTTDPTAEKQLTLLHFGCFSNLFFLAVTVAVMGQTCPCLPAAGAFVFIIITRLVHVLLAFKGPDAELIGMSKKPVMLQVIIGTVLIIVATVYIVLASRDEDYLAFASEMEATAFDKMESQGPLVYFIISVSLFFALMSAPGICMADKMMEGYIPSALRVADKYAQAQMKFYMSFQSREQFFWWLLLAALALMSPDITGLCVVMMCSAVFFMGFCCHCIANKDVYGFAVAGMLFWLISMAIIFGGVGMGVLLM